MLTTPRAQLVEKLITSPEGVVFKATFLVYEEAGKIKARLVKAVQVVQEQVEKILTLCDGIVSSLINGIIPVSFKLEVVSCKLESLYFLGSKPRAPSRI